MSYLDNVRVFVRVVELGTLSAAGRDQRVTPAVASNRIKELERHMGVRLFNRTTRKLTPTEHGRVFYNGAVKILEAVNEAENAIADLSRNPKGALKITAPLGIGRRLIASGIPEFHDKYPDIEVRLRLSDHNVDILSEGVDVAFKLGILEDSNLRMRGIMNCERVVCGAPAYFEGHARPRRAADLKRHRFVGWDEGVSGVQAAEWLGRTVPAGAIAFRSNRLVVQMAAVAEGIGLALLPCYLGDRESRIERAMPPIKELERELWLVTHEDLKRTARVRAFMDFVGAKLVEDRSLFEGRAARKARRT